MEWLAFVLLSVALEVAFRRFVPAENRRIYAQCPKDAAYWAAITLYHSIWIVAAIQAAVSPDSVAPWQQIGGAVFFVAGQAIVIWARAVNPMFIPALAYVPKRLRVTRGPYQIIDHPGYIGMAFAAHGLFLLLGQWWAIVPVGLYQGFLWRRMIVEDRLLSKSSI